MINASHPLYAAYQYARTEYFAAQESMNARVDDPTAVDRFYAAQRCLDLLIKTLKTYEGVPERPPVVLPWLAG